MCDPVSKLRRAAERRGERIVDHAMPREDHERVAVGGRELPPLVASDVERDIHRFLDDHEDTHRHGVLEQEIAPEPVRVGGPALAQAPEMLVNSRELPPDESGVGHATVLATRRRKWARCGAIVSSKSIQRDIATAR